MSPRRCSSVLLAAAILGACGNTVIVGLGAGSTGGSPGATTSTGAGGDATSASSSASSATPSSTSTSSSSRHGGRAGLEPCSPKTCAEQGFDCGIATDGYGHLIDCGSCPIPCFRVRREWTAQRVRPAGVHAEHVRRAGVRLRDDDRRVRRPGVRGRPRLQRLHDARRELRRRGDLQRLRQDLRADDVRRAGHLLRPGVRRVLADARLRVLPAGPGVRRRRRAGSVLFVCQHLRAPDLRVAGAPGRPWQRTAAAASSSAAPAPARTTRAVSNAVTGPPGGVGEGGLLWPGGHVHSLHLRRAGRHQRDRERRLRQRPHLRARPVRGVRRRMPAVPTSDVRFARLRLRNVGRLVRRDDRLRHV